MMRFFASKAIARLSLVSNVSYSVSLFIAENCSLTAYFSISPYGDMSTTLGPLTFFVADPSIWTVHVSKGSSSSL